jgi:hypothetical protein
MLKFHPQRLNRIYIVNWISYFLLFIYIVWFARDYNIEFWAKETCSISFCDDGNPCMFPITTTFTS